jgi:hypothetical protein
MNTIRTLLLLLAASTFAAEIPAELEQAVRARDEAVAKKDADTFDRLTTSDFITVRPDGKLMNKAERLAQLMADEPQARPKPKQEQFIRYGDTVLRQLQAADGTLWIDVWVKEGQVWRVASGQGTRPSR